MPKRAFIEIDKNKCNGCGNCITACAEGALQIINGKAKVVNEIFCDGLGACIGHCPQDALCIIEKDVAAFDEQAVAQHLGNNKFNIPCNCPGMAVDFKNKNIESDTSSELRQWPIQLHLVNPNASYFKNTNLLIAATCTAFSFDHFHQTLLRNHSLIIACPKLDKTEGYIENLVDINEFPRGKPTGYQI